MTGRDPMKGGRLAPGVVMAVLLAAGVLGAASAGAQTPAEQNRAAGNPLRAQVVQKFDVLMLRSSVVLRPKSGNARATSVEVSDDGAISVDAAPVTGVELRQKLGADADLVLQVSYLDAVARRAMFGGAGSAGGAGSSGGAVTPPPPPPTPPPAAEPEPPLVFDRNADRGRGGRKGDRVRIGGSVAVMSGEVIDGDVVAIGGSARVDGQVNGDVVAVGGSVDLGPQAVVTRNVVVVGGALRRADGARVDGRVQEIGAFEFGKLQGPRSLARFWAGSFLGSAFSLVATLVRIAVLCVLAALVLLLGSGGVERVRMRAAAEPFKAGAIGFLAQILFVPVLVMTIVLLVVTIVGIPLLILIPFALAGLLVVALVGFTAVGYQIGGVLNARFGWTRGPYATTIAGIVVLFIPLALARIVGLGGWLATPFSVMLVVIASIVEYVAWTVGFGAVALARFAKQPQPPAEPSPVA